MCIRDSPDPEARAAELAAGKVNEQTYMAAAFVFDPAAHKMLEKKIIATRDCFPDGPRKTYFVNDCIFPGGISLRADGKVNLYTGVSDCTVGRAVLNNPFEGYGKIKNIQL